MHAQKNLKISALVLGFIAGSYFVPVTLFAQPAGCPSGVLTAGNQVITCSTASSSGSPQSATEIGTYSKSAPPPAGSASLTSTGYDGINLTINQYTTISTSASPIGLASGSTVTNSGTLNSTLNNGYGISFGVNGRSQNGGNTATNTTFGQIITSGPNADGMTVSATKASSQGNALTNNGSIATTGSSAYGMSIVSGSSGIAINNSISNSGTVSTQGVNSYGIKLDSSSGVNNVTNSGSGSIATSGSGADGINVTNTRNAVTINNSATISVTGSSATAIRVNGAANITNSGTLNSASSTAIVFGGTLPSGLYNTLTLADTSSINSGIAFNKTSTNETLTFTGYSSNPVFSNAISGLNIINAVNGSTVTMNNSAGYELVSGVINVENTSSSLAITSAIKDQSSPSVTASSITKTGTGNLTLSGSNTYTGITDIQAGSIITGATNTLPSTTAVTVASGAALDMNNYSQSIGSLAGSGAVTLGSGSLTTGNDNTSTAFSGSLSGTGGLTKVGSGIFELSGVSSYTGDTNVNAGTLRLLSDIASNVSIASAANLQGGSVITGNVTNQGNIQPSFSGSTASLTIIGNYVGNNGVFTSHVWGPSTSPIADRLIISGAGNTASGTTGIIAIDRGGLGKPISGNEIPLVTVASGATTGASAFALSGRVASGAYEYNLYRGGAIPGTNQNNWYLRTDNPDPPVIAITPDVRERIEVAVYPALPSLVQMYAQTAVDTLDQRRGDLNLVDPSAFNQKKSNDWARIIGKTGTSTPSNINDGPKLNFNAYALQFGVDLYKNEELSGSRTYVGPYVTIGGANGNTSNQAGTTSTGNINGMQAYSLGLYGTHFAENGLYIDALAQGTRYLNANANSVQGAGLTTQGSGFTGSLEAGGRWNMTEKFLISPQAQIVYDAIGMNNASDAYGQINFNKSEISRGRLGILAGHKDTLASTPIFAYLRANYWSVFNPGTSTTFQSLYGVNPITFYSQTGSRWLALDAEVNARLTKSSNLFLNLGWENSLVGTYQAISGRVGLQTRF